MKPGSLCVPNCLLNRSTQKKLNAPQDGVSALAAVAVASVLTARTPPAMVSDAAVASTLLLMDMKSLSVVVSRALRPAVLRPARLSGRDRSLGGYEASPKPIWSNSDPWGNG